MFTSVFGLYTTYVYIYSKCIYSSILLHSYCNYIGLPSFRYLRFSTNSQNCKIGKFYVKISYFYILFSRNNFVFRLLFKNYEIWRKLNNLQIKKLKEVNFTSFILLAFPFIFNIYKLNIDKFRILFLKNEIKLNLRPIYHLLNIHSVPLYIPLLLLIIDLISFSPL